MGLDEGGDIRDVKGPLGIPFGLGRILLILLATLLIPLLAYALYRRLARRNVEGKKTPEAPSRPAHETALEALDRLERSPLLERGEIKEFHIRVADVLRVYVEERFQVPALESTTMDLLQDMARAGIREDIREGFSSFLGPCDMVKFAKAKPDASTSLGTLRLGRKLVEDTIPTESSQPETQTERHGATEAPKTEGLPASTREEAS